MCGAGNGASSGGKSGGNNNDKTKKVVKPVNNADYQTRAKANKSGEKVRAKIQFTAR